MFNILLANDFPLIPHEVQVIIQPILFIMLVLLSIAMVIIILRQNGTDDNGINALTGSSDTYYGKNKSKTKDAAGKKLTSGVAISLVVLAIIYFVIQVL